MNFPRIIVGQYSDRGLVREENEDSLGWFDTPNGQLFLVADGLGGEAGGKTASEMAVSTIHEVFESGCGPIYPLLKKAVSEANSRIYHKAQSGDPLYRRMGTTVVVLALHDRKAYLAHVGDSRAYLLRKGVLTRLTRDHSQVQAMVDEGWISEEQALGHPYANLLLRCLGSEASVEAELGSAPVDIDAADRFLLCSDGLTGLVRDDEILNVMLEDPDPGTACRSLVSLANKRGGPDNITVQIVGFGP